MAGKIFISYRREDEQSFAVRLYERLVDGFGKERLFFDVDSIPPGFDFVRYIEDQIRLSEIVLVVIGRDWLDAKDAHGRRRLDNPEDFVRIEIEAALKQDKHVIPVLVQGAPMPLSTQLPRNMKPLARRNAFFATHVGFRAEAERLINALNVAFAAMETPTGEQRIAGQEARRVAGIAEARRQEAGRKGAAAIAGQNSRDDAAKDARDRAKTPPAIPDVPQEGAEATLQADERHDRNDPPVLLDAPPATGPGQSVRSIVAEEDERRPIAPQHPVLGLAAPAVEPGITDNPGLSHEESAAAGDSLESTSEQESSSADQIDNAPQPEQVTEASQRPAKQDWRKAGAYAAIGLAAILAIAAIALWKSPTLLAKVERAVGWADQSNLKVGTDNALGMEIGVPSRSTLGPFKVIPGNYAIVANVEPGSPAAAADVPVGDLVWKIDGVFVDDPKSVVNAMLKNVLNTSSKTLVITLRSRDARYTDYKIRFR